MIILKSGDIIRGNSDARGYGYTTVSTHWVYVHHNPNDFSEIGVLGIPRISDYRDKHYEACIELQKYINQNYDYWQTVINRRATRDGMLDYIRRFFPFFMKGIYEESRSLSFFYVRERAFNVDTPIAWTNKERRNVLKKLGDDIVF